MEGTGVSAVFLFLGALAIMGAFGFGILPLLVGLAALYLVLALLSGFSRGPGTGVSSSGGRCGQRGRRGHQYRGRRHR